MGREEYTKCMIPHMKGGGPDRKLRFCIGAKVCSGKASTEDRAREICLSEPAKEPKPRASKAGKCITEAPKLAACLSTNLEVEGLSSANLPGRLEAALVHCQSKNSGAPTQKKFMNSCMKEADGGVDLKSSLAQVKNCQAQWAARQGG